MVMCDILSVYVTASKVMATPRPNVMDVKVTEGPSQCHDKVSSL